MKLKTFIQSVILSIVFLNALSAAAQSDLFDLDLLAPQATNDKIVFNSTASGNSEIMRIDSDGSNLTNLTNNTANDFAPEYSPTLDKFVFVSNRTGTNQIFVMNADGTNPVNLSNSPMSDDTNPSWSPDGAKIVFVRNSADNNEDGVTTMNADGSNQFRVYYLSNFSGKPAFSPDGTYILFYDGFNVLSVEPNGANISFVVSADSSSTAYLSPDGAKLLFVNFDEFGVRQIFTGTNYTQLTFFATDAIFPKWSPDGSKITFAVISAPNAYRIYTMNADGSNQTELTPNPVSTETYSFPEWSPDNLRIALTGNYQISSQNFTGLGKINSDGTNLSFLAAADLDKPLSWIDPTPLPVLRFTRAGVFQNSDLEGVFTQREIKILRSGNLSAATTVNYATADGTAIAGQDYTATNGTLDFAAGEISKTIIVEVIDDTVIEADESFSLTLSNPSGGTIAPPATQILTIRNDDTQYEFHAASLNQSVSESNTEAQFRIVRTGFLNDAAITFSTSDGTATAPQDYSTVSTNINFAESQTEAIISVTLNPDNFDEINEFFTVTLSNPPFGATLGANSATTFTILDDDADTTHTIEKTNYSVRETGGVISVKVKRNLTGGASTVAYQTVNGTATQPGDYTETTGTLNFAVGVSELTINIPIILNPAAESDETFQFQIFNPAPGNLGSPNSAVITIFDNTRVLPGDLDTTFDSDGILTDNFPGGGTSGVTDTVVQPDGKIIVVGSYANPVQQFAVARYNADGSPDTSFDGDGKVTTEFGGFASAANSVAVQTNGKIVAAGTVFNGGNNDFAIVRYNADGSLDTTFDGDGRVTTAVGFLDDAAESVAIQADGKIVAAGEIDEIGTGYPFALVRYNADGSLDTSFDGDGKVTTKIGIANDFAHSVAIQADGKIIAAGVSVSITSNADFTLVRYNPNGSLDTTFDGDGKVTTPVATNGTLFDAANSIALQNDGKIIAAGVSTNGTDSDFALVRYNTDGSLDSSFDGDGKLTTAVGTLNDSANSVLIQTDGKIVAAGISRNSSTVDDFAVVRYHLDGSLDNLYGSGGKATYDLGSGENDFALGAALDSSGRAVVAGFFRALDGSGEQFALIRLIGNLPPTAANVSVGGRVTNSNGYGIGKTRVSLTDSNGETRTLQTNAFGSYRFDEVPAGETYFISVNHKKYVFSPNMQILNVSDDLSDINFTTVE